jgi:hypothetical protein
VLVLVSLISYLARLEFRKELPPPVEADLKIIETMFLRFYNYETS